MTSNLFRRIMLTPRQGDARDGKGRVAAMDIAETIRRAREARGLGKAEFARKVGVTRQTVHDWENGRSGPKRTRVQTVADILNIPAAALATDSSEINVAFLGDEEQDRHRVPLLDWVDAGRGAEVVSAKAIEYAQDYVQVDYPVSANTFALEVRGDSMRNEFSEGDTIIVDPTRAARLGDYVVAEVSASGRPEGDGNITFKQYRPRGEMNGVSSFDLVPLNPVYPTITVNKNQPGRIIGVVIEHRRKFL